MFDEARNERRSSSRRGSGRGVQHASGIAKRNRVPVDMRYAVVYTIQDGKIIRGREYATRAEALEAAGWRGRGDVASNVAIVEVLMDAVNRRDIDTFAGVTTPDFEWFRYLPPVEG